MWRSVVCVILGLSLIAMWGILSVSLGVLELLFVALGSLFCGLIGALFGQPRRAAALGFAAGAALGVIGWLLMLAADNRPQCPHCGGRVAGGYQRCSHCGQTLGKPKPVPTASPFSRPVQW